MITILQPISDSATTIAVTPDPLLPQDSGLILIGSEQITYTTVYMNTLYGCVRGANSTTPASHAAGSSVTILSFFVANSASDVTGVHADSNSDITGSVQLVSGTNIILSQSGQAITVNASGGGASFPLLAPDGSNVAPSYSFASDTTSGMYWDNTNLILSLATNSGAFVALDGMNALVNVNAPLVIVSPAGLYFDSTSGFSLDTTSVAASMSLAFNAAPFLSFPNTADSIQAAVPFLASDGSSSVPSLSFTSTPTAGFWLSAAKIALGSGVTEFSIPPTAALAFTSTSDPASIGPRFSYDGTDLSLAFTSGNFVSGVPIVSSAPSGVQFTGTLDTTTGMSIVTSFSQPSIVFTAANTPTVTIIGNLVALGAATDLFPNGAGALSPTAATGFIYVSHSSGGAPTGNPGNNGAMFFDAATNTLYIFSVANGWKSVVLS